MSLFPPHDSINPVCADPAQDWTFHGAATRTLTHCYHDYPARMIPPIARRLLKMFATEGQTLFDPYCGTGTSLVEGMMAGLKGIGTDLNPLARLIATAKTSPIPIDVLDETICRFDDFLASKSSQTTIPVEVAGIERLDFWFKPQVIQCLSYIKTFFQSIEDEAIRRFFQVGFSETVRESSNTRNHEFKLYRLAEEALVQFQPNVYDMMRTKLRRNRQGLQELLQHPRAVTGYNRVAVYDFNTVEGVPCEILPPRSVDIVLTSPPYGDSGTTVAYGQYSRLSSAWLGLPNPHAVDKRLMGGQKRTQADFASQPLREAIRKIADVDEKRAREVASFYGDLQDSIENIASCIRRGGYACYVVGNRRVKGITLPTDDMVRRTFERHGFVWVDTFLRAIPNKRMPSRNSPSNIAGAQDATMTQEHILVMRRE